MTDSENRNKNQRMKELIALLDEAAKAYYREGREIMTNYKYDALYDELVQLEEETGVVLSGSPTVRVGYEVASALPKEKHPSRMLSLDKTKDPAQLSAWLKDKEGLLSWKLDGLTIVLTYEGGELKKAVTRGNGDVGEVITPNARFFTNLPQRIAFKGTLVVRGEAVISYEDFEKINSLIDDESSRYKNPRNLCSGSVRQLDPAVTKERRVQLVAFALVSASENGQAVDFENSNEKKYDFLKGQGFDVVEHVRVTSATLEKAIGDFSAKIGQNAFPSDGLVLLLDDIAYGESLGTTAKAPRNAMAFKWQDETANTILRRIEWSPSRTGLINPVAVFDSVELEGTQVTRASVHNLSIVKELKLGIGDEITVYKANMIIPQIAENLTASGKLTLPEVCPACGMPVSIHSENDTETLFCENPDCSAKQIKAFALYCSRDAMNVEGLSEQTLEKFTGCGFIKEFADIYHLDRYAGEITGMEGFGEKSYKNLMEAVDRSRHTTMSKFLYAIGIPGIGTANAVILSRHFDGDFEAVMNASREELSSIDGIGAVMAGDIIAYFADEKKKSRALAALAELEIEKEAAVDTGSPVYGLTFVVTGSVEHFANRNELKAFIEERGGKVTGSVTSKTDFLINNDTESSSSKNKKAKELGVAIISEQEFMERFG